MRLKRILLLFFLVMVISSIAAPFAFADIPTPQETFGKVGNLILYVFGASWIKDKGEDVIGAFFRMCIWIFVFTILYFVSRQIFQQPGLQRNSALIVAIVIATMSTIFIPINILLAIGELYATAVSFIMIAIPLVGIGALYYLTWGRPGRFWVIVRIAILILLWILLAIVTASVGGGL